MTHTLPIITYPNPLLRKRAKEVLREELPALQALIAQMIATMQKSDGVGLAAPQVNVSRRIIVVNYRDGARAYINPVLTKKSLRKERGEEGCLSIPKVFGEVKRHRSVHISAWDVQGRVIEQQAHGLFARVLQHEVDHIDGILFIDRTEHITRGKIERTD